MPTIPLPSIPSVQRAAAPGAMRNVAAAGAEYRANAEMGQQIGGAVASTIMVFHEKSQRLQAAAAEAKVRLEMAKVQDDIDLMAAEDANPDHWEPKAQARVEQANATFDAAKGRLSTEAKDSIDRAVAQWRQDITTGVKYKAISARNKESDAVLQMEIDSHYEAGRVGAGDEAVDKRVAMGSISKPRGDLLKEQGRVRGDWIKATALIMADPIQAEDMITEEQFKHLNKTDLLSLQKKARAEASALRAETVRDMDLAAASGELRDADIDAAMLAKKITPQQAKWMRQNITGKTDYSQNVVRMAELTRRITSWSPADKNADETLNKIAADLAGLPRSMQDSLEAKIRERAAGGLKASQTVDAERYIDTLFDSNFLGNVQKQKADEDEPGSPVNKEEFVAAAAKSVELRTKLEAFVAANPKATAMEQIQFIDTEIRKDRAKRGATKVLQTTGRNSSWLNNLSRRR